MTPPLDPSLIRAILLSLAGVLCVAIVGFSVVGGIAFGRVQKGAGRSFGLLFQRGNFLRIVTVLAVIQAVVILAMLGRLTDGAAAVLSGVAGYVLGGLERSGHAPAGESPARHL